MRNIQDYEPVKARKLRFYQDHPDGRIVAELVDLPNIERFALFKASVYLNAEDQARGLPRGVGYAFELRDLELKQTRDGKTYESVNFSSWCENAEESACGRALDQAGYASNMRCSREEMEKVQRFHAGNGIKPAGDFDKALQAVAKANDINTLDTLKSQLDGRVWSAGEKEKIIANIDARMNEISKKIFGEGDHGEK